MNDNILSLTNDKFFKLADINLTNKVFSNNFDKKKYKLNRDKYILSLIEEQTLKHQTEQFKQMYQNKKNELEKRILKTKKYKARLVEMEIQNTKLFDIDIDNNLTDRKNYASKLRDNKCPICHNLIYGKPIKIRKLIQNQNIGDWVYNRNKPNISCKLDCDHIFHSHCISTWFNQKSECPMCRDRINLWENRRLSQQNQNNLTIARLQNQSNFTIDDNSSDISVYSDLDDISDIILGPNEPLNQNQNQEEEKEDELRPSESQPVHPVRQIRITSATTFENIQQGIEQAERWGRESRSNDDLFPLPELINPSENEEIENENNDENNDENNNENNLDL
jgi:hypothetical protein